MEGQPRISDLVPTRGAWYLGALAAGVLIVATLEGLYTLMPLLAPATTDGRVATFDLDGEGSLAVWFSTLTLAAAAGAAWLLAAIVRHLPGASRRSGRLWIWAGVCWITMSGDECASLHEAFKEMMSHSTGQTLYGDGSIWWVLAYFLVLSATGLRLLWAMRTCGGAAAALLGTAALYAVAVSAELGLILPYKNEPGIMLEEGCEMLGNVCLLVSMLLMARHTLATAREQQRLDAAMQSAWESYTTRRRDGSTSAAPTVRAPTSIAAKR